MNGVLDLRGWDFKKDGRVSTNGYWQFYYNDFLDSRQFDTIAEKCYTWVPGVWKSKYIQAGPNDTVRDRITQIFPSMPWQKSVWKGNTMGATGYASYRLTILFPPGQSDLMFKVQDVGTAMELYVNDSLVASSGQIGKTKETSVPQYLPHMILFHKLKDTTNLTYWISNFHYRKGGPWKEIIIGDSKQLGNYNKNLLIEQIFVLGLWCMVCFVMLCFFYYIPKQKYILYIFLGSVACFIRSITADDRLITLFYPNIDFDLLVKLEIITGLTGVISFILVVHILYPAEFPKWFRDINVVATVILVVGALTTPTVIYSNLVVPFQLFHFFNLTYGSIQLIVAVKRKREGALILAIPYLFVFATSVSMILFYNQITNIRLENYYQQVAVILAFAQVILLTRLFSSALKRVENFAGELELTVAQRTRELVEAQDQLVKVARQTENENIRRRISQDIHDDISSGLNKISWMGEMVKIKSLKNKPEEVNATLDKIIKSSRETVDHLIEIIWSLNPNNDDLENLLAYIRNYAHKFFDETPFSVKINFPEQVEKIEINPELKRNIFLVIKEALHNAAKYSRAENITIDFTFQDSSFLFMITDDGIGIEEGVIKGTGNGMMNMKKRMEDVNGRFTVESETGKGTRIILEGILH